METIIDMSEKEYREFTENRRTTHFLQSYEWGTISKTRGLVPYYLGLKDDGKIKATALLLKKQLPMGYSYFYIPRGFTIDYSDTELLAHFTEEIKKFAKKHKALFFKIDPDIKLHCIDESAEPIEGENNYELVETLKKLGYKRKKLNKYFENMQPRFTFRINLTPDIDEIESRYTTTTVQRIKKAEKNGVWVEKGTIDDVKEFARLMKLTEMRQNFYSHNEKFFHTFYEEFSKGNHVSLYLGKIDIAQIVENYEKELKVLNEEMESLKDVESKKANNRKKEISKNIKTLEEQLEYYRDKPREKIVVSSYIIVHYGNKSWALYAANDMEYKRLFANYLVYKEQIRDAKERGDDIFDVFGTIGEPNAQNQLVGLHDFKKKWGGEYTEFIGEFDYVLKPFINLAFKTLVPIRHKIINWKLRKEVKK